MREPTSVVRHLQPCRGAAVLVVLLVVAGASAQESLPTGASPAAEQPPLLAEPFETPRQLLSLLDIGDSDWNSFRDGYPLMPDDQEALVKVLFRMPQIGWDDIERWQRVPESWAALSAAPATVRGEFFQLRGRVRKITPRPLLPRLAALFEFDQYFELEMVTDKPPGLALVLTRTIPDAWRDRTQLDERAAASAMFLKVGEARAGVSSLLFAAPRMAWLPDRSEPELGIGPDQVWLANLGMDVGLLDQVRARNRLPIGTEERECFYAMLNAVGRAEAGELSQRAQPATLAALLQSPEREQGRILRVEGKVRRITKVVVDEPDVQRRFGISAYYQLDVMVPVGNQTIEVRGAQGEAAGPIYRHVFPCTFCAVRLPPAWDSLVGAPGVSRLAVLDGVFLKLWAFSNPLVASIDERQRQLSPMFVVDEPSEAELPAESTSGGGVLFGIGCLVVLVTVWVVVWRMNRSDRKFAEKTRGTRFSQDPTPSFDDLDGTPPNR
ncbi:MAG: hypothetical protein ACYC3X_02975 [Pirellulaceae bacterium]